MCPLRRRWERLRRIGRAFGLFRRKMPTSWWPECRREAGSSVVQGCGAYSRNKTKGKLWFCASPILWLSPGWRSCCANADANPTTIAYAVGADHNACGFLEPKALAKENDIDPFVFVPFGFPSLRFPCDKRTSARVGRRQCRSRSRAPITVEVMASSAFTTGTKACARFRMSFIA